MHTTINIVFVLVSVMFTGHIQYIVSSTN